jgi:antitoxin component YwqK of YwqJK toxin-antitoxin module
MLQYKIYWLIILISGTLTGYAQKRMEVEATNRVYMQKADTIYEFYAIKPPQKLRSMPPDIEKEYYWYKSDNILVTRGGFDGRILHGSYKVYYPNQNLNEKGSFYYGMKDGVWKTWYPNGNLQSEQTWNKGQKEGDYTFYDMQGKRVKQYTYKRDLLSGYQFEYHNDTLTSKIMYKDGKIIPESPAILRNKRRDSTND